MITELQLLSNSNFIQAIAINCYEKKGQTRLYKDAIDALMKCGGKWRIHCRHGPITEEGLQSGTNNCNTKGQGISRVILDLYMDYGCRKIILLTSRGINPSILWSRAIKTLKKREIFTVLIGTETCKGLLAKMNPVLFPTIIHDISPEKILQDEYKKWLKKNETRSHVYVLR